MWTLKLKSVSFLALVVVAISGCSKSPPADEKLLGNAGKALPQSTPSAIEVKDLSFAGPRGHRPNATYRRGEEVYCLMTLRGFTYKEGRAHLTADLTVKGPKQQLVIVEKNIQLLQGPAPTATPGTIRSMATFRLPSVAVPGKHTVLLQVTDRLGNRHGQGQSHFELVGKTAKSPSTSFSISPIKLIATERTPPESVVPAHFTVFSPKAQRTKATVKPYQVDLGFTVELFDSKGKSISQDRRTLHRRQYHSPPSRIPLEDYVVLPKTLSPGSYTVKFVIEDRIAKMTREQTVPLAIGPRRFGIFQLYLHDLASLPRRQFRFGEQVRVRLSVQGFKVRRGETDISIDLAVAGPDGGVYLAHQNVAKAQGEKSRAIVKAGRFPLQLPLTLPQLAPTGKYKIVVRAKQRIGKKKLQEVAEEIDFDLQGPSLPHLSAFKVDKLIVRERADLLPSKGDTFIAGRSYLLTARVGGMKLEEIRKLTYELDLIGHLRIRTLGGKLIHEKKDLFQSKRRLHHRPLRVQMTGTWTVPGILPPGLYNLEVVALNKANDRVSQLVRRVEIASPRR